MSRSFLIAITATLGLFGSLLVRPAYSQDISDTALQQIKELLDEKASRTPAQQKLGSQLVYAVKTASGQPITPSLPSFPGSGLTVSSANGVLVDIKGSVTSDLLAAISQAGGRVIYASASFGSVRAQVPLLAIEGLAARSDVSRIKPGSLPKAQRQRPAVGRWRGVSAGLERWRGQLIPFQLARLLGTAFFIGATTTQGVVTHAANTARATYGASGAGVKVGVLSDSAEQIPLLIATGDLPPDVVNVQEIIGGPGTSEGTAMMEIVYDMAPGAKLFFASAFNGPDSFAQNILDLKNIYGCDIIVDDVSYSDEGVFQDSTIALAVNAVTTSGALYFSSAANSGNLTSGTSTTYEGDFNAGGSNALLPGYTLHNFSGGLLYNRMLQSFGVIDFQWSDPLGGSSNDYDLFILNSAGTAVVAASTTIQSGTQDPFEEIFSPNGFAANSRVVIAAKAGAQPRALHIDAFFGDSQPQVSTSGATSGHNAGASTVGVAAVAWNSARGITRPFPGGALNPTELFSSDGPRRIFYNPNGTAITPGNLLFATNGGLVLTKPDIAAADGVSTRTPGFSPFYGTSAASPHAAAVAALVKSAKPSLTAAQIYNAMISTALDIRAPGIDRDSGNGLVMADKAVAKGLQ